MNRRFDGRATLRALPIVGVSLPGGGELSPLICSGRPFCHRRGHGERSRIRKVNTHPDSTVCARRRRGFQSTIPHPILAGALSSPSNIHSIASPRPTHPQSRTTISTPPHTLVRHTLRPPSITPTTSPHHNPYQNKKNKPNHVLPPLQNRHPPLPPPLLLLRPSNETPQNQPRNKHTHALLARLHSNPLHAALPPCLPPRPARQPRARKKERRYIHRAPAATDYQIFAWGSRGGAGYWGGG